MTGFADVFGAAPEGVWLAPGRANVIGEHTDYNDGYVLPIALPHRVLASVARRTDGLLRVASAQQPGAVVELPMTEVRAGNPAGWAGYVAGVAEQFELPGGLSVFVDGDVPAGAGLSSSAAVTCSVALALRDLLRPDLPTDALVDVARRAENDFVGAPTGILDQSASLLCEPGHALFLDTRDRTRRQVPLDLAAAGTALLVVDTGHAHSHADGGYGDRRRECESAAEALGVPALRDATAEDVETLADEVLRRRARHIVAENGRVLTVVDLLTGGGDPRAIGPVLTAGHVSLRDDFEISTPELDAVVDTALAHGAHGARMVGGGFGGSAVVLVDADEVDRVATAVQPVGGSYRTFVAVPSSGAHRVS
ncbi:galactokinase [Klenkia marina]|uniref:Galactokinase n=1 Tax=Klenkia marina TaxID=1960309 RepID=A0A1G4YHA8_9ACTN|nr:galactokinase [Klenkia marina]SCX52872.1 galactokinase [Klenkia marina]